MATITLWKDKEKKVLDPLLFSDIAGAWAKQIHHDGLDIRGREKRNSRTQLRRFFDEINRLDNKSQEPDSDWDVILPQVHMLVAKVAYARGRDLITDSFVELFGKTIREELSTKDDLRVFSAFFEAFMGFYTLYRKK